MSFFSETAFPWVVSKEGGFGIDPHDKGNWTGGEVGEGELRGTKYGISAAAYPYLDIANLSLEQAAAIAKTKYWDVFHGDELPPPLALCVFDFGYNAGVHAAVVTLQRLLSLVPDGNCGPLTCAAANRNDQSRLIEDYAAARLAFYKGLSTWPRYGRGWEKRNIETCRKAQSLVI